MSNRSSPCVRIEGADMDNGTGRDEAWVQLVREIIGSWPLVLRAAVLVLACTPVAAVVTLVLLAAR